MSLTGISHYLNGLWVDSSSIPGTVPGYESYQLSVDSFPTLEYKQATMSRPIEAAKRVEGEPDSSLYVVSLVVDVKKLDPEADYEPTHLVMPFVYDTSAEGLPYLWPADRKTADNLEEQLNVKSLLQEEAVLHSYRQALVDLYDSTADAILFIPTDVFKDRRRPFTGNYGAPARYEFGYALLRQAMSVAEVARNEDRLAQALLFTGEALLRSVGAQSIDYQNDQRIQPLEDIFGQPRSDTHPDIRSIDLQLFLARQAISTYKEAEDWPSLEAKGQGYLYHMGAAAKRSVTVQILTDSIQEDPAAYPFTVSVMQLVI